MMTDGCLLDPSRQRPTRFEHVDADDLNPTHDCRVPLERTLRPRREHRKPLRELGRPRQPEYAVTPSLRILVRMERDDDAALGSTQPERKPLCDHDQPLFTGNRRTLAPS